MLQGIVDAVRGSDTPPVVPGLLRPVDVDALARDLELKDKGKERGAKERPATTESLFDTVEQEVVQRVESEWAWNGGELLKELRAYGERIASFSVSAEIVRLRVVAKNAIARLVAANHQAEADLAPLKDRYVLAREELAAFRERHRLKRDARRPSRPLTTWGLLVVLVGVESIINGLFFAPGADLGIAGGVGTALGISGFNIIFAFLLGLWPARWINHRNYLLKLLGLIVLFPGIAVLFGLHAFAAHFRDAMAIVGEDGAFAAAIANLTQAPWDVRDHNSVYLFALGMLFALLSLWKGYRIDDPYPGYGAMSRRFDHAREEYSDQHRDLFDELEERKEDAVTQLQSGIRRLPLFPQEAARLRAVQNTRIEQFRAFEATVETAANQLLQIYREANTDARQSAAPKHFSELWRLPHRFLDRAPPIVTGASAEQTDKDAIEKVLAELRQLADDVLGEYRKLLSHYPHPSQIGGS